MAEPYEPLSLKLRHRHVKAGDRDVEVWFSKNGRNITLNTKSVQGETGRIYWTGCESSDCLGEALPGSSRCFAHSENTVRRSYLEATFRKDRTISLKGIVLTPALFAEIIASPYVDNKRVLGNLFLTGVEIETAIELDGYAFTEALSLSVSLAAAQINFRNCEFSKGLSAQFLTIGKGAFQATKSRFLKAVSLPNAHTTDGYIRLQECELSGSLKLDGVTSPVDIRNCHIRGDLSFPKARAQFLRFDECRVDGNIDASGAHCEGFSARSLVSATAQQFGPLTVERFAGLQGAHFERRLRLELAAQQVDLSRADFAHGGHVIVERADVDLTQVRTGAQLDVSGTLAAPAPSIVSVGEADLGMMRFAHLDMSRCVFSGAHQLAGTTIASTVKFAKVPAGRTKRRCVADEFAWRFAVGGWHARGWKLDGTISGKPPLGPGKPKLIGLPPLTPSQVSAVYRDLRRSFEAKANEPEANDFYYGEMEMRRHDRSAPLPERVLVLAYWLSSGYGLRASRALFWFVAVLASAIFVAGRWGFTGEVDMTRSVLFVLRAAIPGLKRPELGLTTIGAGVEIAVASLCPILAALGLLAVRGRVKR